MTDNEMYTRGLRQGRREALADAIDAVRDLADDSKPMGWDEALKAVDDKLVELMGPH
jgi:hypothetical protein